MYTLEEFTTELNNDIQRNNMFSVIFATTPTSKTKQLLDSFGGYLYNDTPLNMSFLGLTQGAITNAIQTVAVQGTQRLVRRSGVSKYLLGAMSNRTVQSLLGEFEVGTYMVDFFNMGNTTTGLLVHSVKMPDNKLNYTMDRTHHSPTIRIGDRVFDPLVITFRMDSEARNYRALNDWVNAVDDPVTGLRALPDDVEADIQVNLHHRNGLPHTVSMFSGCIPVAVSAPELSYENDNQISTFDVTFAYRTVQTGAVDGTAVKDWLTDTVLPNLGSMAGRTLRQMFG